MFLIPIERDNPTRHHPYVVYALLILNVVATLGTIFMNREVLYRDYGFVPTDPSLVSAVTSMFLHANLWHLLGNMFFLWMFGDNIEDVIGSLGFLGLYLLCGLAAAGSHMVVGGRSDVPLIGASGAISGIVGLYLAFFPRMPTDLVFYFFWWEIKTLQVTTVGAVGVWFGEQLLLGLLLRFTGLDEYIPIAFWAHVGGAVAGLLAGLALVNLGYVRRYADDGRRNPFVGYVSSMKTSDLEPTN